ncbi:hypothetical protein YC2023_098922 [Brassica napus]
MKSKPDLALDSSSIGGRVRSKKQKAGVGPSESMDISGSSLDLTAEGENLSRVVAEPTSPAVEAYRFHPVGPLSIIRVERVANWREKYHLSNDVAIRIPGPIDRVLDFKVDEVPVYEGFFESGFRDRVPSLVAKVSEALEIYPGVPSTDSSLGKRTTERVLKLPIERRQVPFLVSREALERCSIWGSKGEEALAEYKRAFEVISAKMIAPKRAAPSTHTSQYQKTMKRRFLGSSKKEPADSRTILLFTTLLFTTLLFIGVLFNTKLLIEILFIGGTVHLDTIHLASIDTVHTPSIDTVHTPSIDTVYPPSIDTIHPPLIDTVHSPSIDTVHSPSIDTVHPPSIDNVHPASIDIVHRDTVLRDARMMNNMDLKRAELSRRSRDHHGRFLGARRVLGVGGWRKA